MKSIPHKCPTCCNEVIETDDGPAPNFFGLLIFPRDPKPYLCKNCATPLVPSDPDQA